MRRGVLWGLLLLGIGLHVGLRAPVTPPPAVAPLLWPQLAGHPAQVQSIRLRRGELPVVELLRTSAGWVVAPGGYPARGAQVEALLAALGQARLQERRTAQAINHARLGLAAAGDGAGLRVTLTPGDERTLLIGDLSARGGQLVRWLDEDQVWLADRSLQVPVSDLAWLDRRILSLAPEQIRRIELQSGQRVPQVLERASAQAGLQAPGLDAAAANAIGGLLATLEAVDVLPLAQLEFSGRPVLQLRIEDFDGGWLQAALYRRGDGVWLVPGNAHGLQGALHWQAGWALRIDAQQYALLAAAGG